MDRISVAAFGSLDLFVLLTVATLGLFGAVIGLVFDAIVAATVGALVLLVHFTLAADWPAALVPVYQFKLFPLSGKRHRALDLEIALELLHDLFTANVRQSVIGTFRQFAVFQWHALRQTGEVLLAELRIIVCVGSVKDDFVVNVLFDNAWLFLDLRQVTMNVAVLRLLAPPLRRYQVLLTGICIFLFFLVAR